MLLPNVVTPCGTLTSLNFPHPKNAESPIYCTESGISRDIKDEHPASRFLSIRVKLFGKLIETSDWHPEKTPAPNAITPSGKLTCCNPWHPQNTPSAISVTPAGTLKTPCQLLQFWNAYRPTVTPGNHSSFSSLWQPLNAYSPIFLMLLGIFTFTSSVQS